VKELNLHIGSIENPCPVGLKGALLITKQVRYMKSLNKDTLLFQRKGYYI
jgi:hypothetical protein